MIFGPSINDDFKTPHYSSVRTLLVDVPMMESDLIVSIGFGVPQSFACIRVLTSSIGEFRND